MEIKPEDDDLKLSPERNYSEYFEEDVKEEILDEKNPDSDWLICDICSTGYKSKRNLNQHIQSAHKGLKFPCDQCVYQATRKDKLWAHIRSVHEKVKYPCNQCEYKATTQSNLKSHYQRKH